MRKKLVNASVGRVVIERPAKSARITIHSARPVVVIAIRNRGLHSAFTLRKVSNGVGVERVFQTHSPAVDSIAVKRKGAVRKAKLYYLRERSGKSARIKERLGE